MSNEADYIIVGAGSAGCVLTAEISRRKLGSVFLIEAGAKSAARNLKVPVLYPHAFKGSNAWQYETTPQAGLAGRRVQLPAGKTLGGSSAINAMIYLRGHSSDYKQWEQIVGTDWSPANVAIAFAEMEKSIRIDDAPRPDLHPATHEFLELATRSGIAPLPEPFLEPAIGVGAYARCQSNGRRRSAWDLWLKQQFNFSHKESFIRLISNASVQHLVIDQQKIVGVAIAANDIASPAETLSARKGVIVCAGAIQSPRLLLASGLGDANELANIGVSCQVDLPAVGQNFQDHLLFPVVRELKSLRSLPSRMNDAERFAYAKDRSGPMNSNIAEVGGFFALPQQSDEPMEPATNALDFQWHVTPTHYLEYPTKAEPTSALSIGVSLCQPTSRGSVRLARATHSDSKARLQLEIDPAYLTSAEDLPRLLAAVQYTRSIFEGERFSELVGDELMPGAKRQRDEQVAASLARFATTVYHYVGTCSMGSETSGVVDGRFRVRGVDGLWVCDASAMPRLVSCNTQATVMMMAYRLSGWLK
ncbi:MAG: GMC family oxidoreductase [Planctomycetota bacterium]|nr:GMC family oxidoreductase [Planctomycetota bacterium]